MNMSLNPETSTRSVLAGARAESRIDAAQRDFASILLTAGNERNDVQARAEEFVAMTLVQPILAQLRSSSSAAPPFAPTSAERQFQAMADAQVARDITRAMKLPLVQRIGADFADAPRNARL